MEILAHVIGVPLLIGYLIVFAYHLIKDLNCSWNGDDYQGNNKHTFLEKLRRND